MLFVKYITEVNFKATFVVLNQENVHIPKVYVCIYENKRF